MKALEDLSLQYDNSVRNSEQTIVQLSYGDDGLNPDRMENNGRPIDYERLHMNIRESSPCSLSSALGKLEANQCLEEFVEAAGNEGKLPRNNVFLQEMRDWVSAIYNNNKTGNPLLTATHLQRILTVAADRFTRAHVEPGEALGATAAQSISEPATQMTLKVRVAELQT
jgi:DNA-directed RNA polymerase III subunit RPC1